jgi:hypothetical protein
MAINFIRVSPTGSVPSTQPLKYDEELRNNLLETQTYDDADLRHWDIFYFIFKTKEK